MIEKTQSKLCWQQKDEKQEVKSGGKEKESYSNNPMNIQSKRDVKETDLTYRLEADNEKTRSNHAKAKAKWRAKCRLKILNYTKRMKP